ncbi:uncharacterized protein LOC132624079 [Lycium barbarum]|uniref:uncharacterized protein LOC132624079 n=1 Tax=Lycium barbarum TaxID=112863 RepID=UPI00293E8F3B|nr:uncharacterized protein LOC132624079 [Lycium barbarum]
MQNGKAVAYTSRQLKKHEKNYPAHDLELVAVIFALKIWRHYLYSENCDVFTDHKSLQYIFKQKSIGTLAYLRAQDMLMGREIQRLSSLRVRLDETEDGELMGITQTRGEYSSFTVGADDDVLRLQGRLCVPDVDGLRQGLMVQAHSSKYSMHPGSTKMYKDLKQRCWWKSIKVDISNFVAKCLNCQQVNLIMQRLKTAQSRQNSYTDMRRHELEFVVGDTFFLKVLPMKGVMRFSRKGKLSPHFIGPYEIVRRIGKVAYELKLPS